MRPPSQGIAKPVWQAMRKLQFAVFQLLPMHERSAVSRITCVQVMKFAETWSIDILQSVWAESFVKRRRDEEAGESTPAEYPWLSVMNESVCRAQLTQCLDLVEDFLLPRSAPPSGRSRPKLECSVMVAGIYTFARIEQMCCEYSPVRDRSVASEWLDPIAVQCSELLLKVFQYLYGEIEEGKTLDGVLLWGSSAATSSVQHAFKSAFIHFIKQNVVRGELLERVVAAMLALGSGSQVDYLLHKFRPQEVCPLPCAFCAHTRVLFDSRSYYCP